MLTKQNVSKMFLKRCLVCREGKTPTALPQKQFTVLILFSLTGFRWLWILKTSFMKISGTLGLSGFRPVPACHNTFLATNLPEHVPISPSYCPIVFIWKDSHEGPYKVLTCARRTFPLQIGRVEVVSQHGALNQDFTEETPAVSESVIFNLILLIIGS